MGVTIQAGRAIVKYNEVSDSTLATLSFNPGYLYVTPTGRMYLDSFVNNQRIQIAGPISVTTTVDFNNYKSSGVYLVSSTSNTNTPTNAQGLLEVFSDTHMIIQRFTVSDSVLMYTRSGTVSSGNVTWNAWKRVGDI